MVQFPEPNIKSVSRLINSSARGYLTLQAEEVSIDNISKNQDLISCISYKLARDTGLDSCDIAHWISKSLKEYWADVESARSIAT